MYELDGIVYGSEPSADMSVTRIKDVGDYILLVTFSTGETRLVDCTELFGLPALQRIADMDVFNTHAVVDGVLTWLDGKVDISPEGLYERSYEYPVAV
ncbi:MAG: DUF2442 domain-containing protein [Coriobacteriales bacterium]|nr:DUF2442 domain-containing protein [Coriobacteriales bacterium]